MRILALCAALSLCLSCATREAPREIPSEEPPVQEAPESEPPAAQLEEFVVTEEIYTRTFDEIEDFIRNLNQIIRNEDYDTWLANLSEEYIRTCSEPAFLKAQSEKPLLKQGNIVLESLKDYFAHVVVPSRIQAELNEIEFLDEDHVKAISVVRGTRVVLYLLVRDGGKWKIGVW